MVLENILILLQNKRNSILVFMYRYRKIFGILKSLDFLEDNEIAETIADVTEKSWLEHRSREKKTELIF